MSFGIPDSPLDDVKMWSWSLKASDLCVQGGVVP